MRIWRKSFSIYLHSNIGLNLDLVRISQIKFCNSGPIRRESFNDTLLELLFAEALYTMCTFVFVLFLSPLHSALYNIPYFGIEISHVCSLIDLILCHYMYWADHYISDCVMKYQVEDVSLSRINLFHTSPQDIG